MNTQKRYRAFGLYIAVILILALLWVLRDSSSGFGQNASYKTVGIANGSGEFHGQHPAVRRAAS